MKLCRGLRIILLILSCGSLTGAQANINAQLEAFFNQGAKNYTAADWNFDGEKGPLYATGPSGSVRFPISNLTPLSIQIPTVEAGCGGIDFNLGAFSAIKWEDLKNFLQNVMANAKGYAFKLAIATASPMAAGVANEVQTFANRLSSSNINSCEAAAALVGSLVPKHHAASAAVCSTVGRELGVFSDHVAARHGCNTSTQDPDKKAEITQGIQKRYPYQLTGEYNLVWKALQLIPPLRAEPKLAEIFMNVTGTILSKKGKTTVKKDETAKEEEREIDVLSFVSNEATQDALWKGLLEGGQLENFLSCDESSQCLNLTPKTLHLNKNEGLIHQIKASLSSLQEKFRTDQGTLSDDEKTLLHTSPLPIRNLLQRYSGQKVNEMPLPLDEFAQFIAADRVSRYFEGMLTYVGDALAQLEKQQADPTVIKKLSERLDKSMNTLRTDKRQRLQQFDQHLRLLELVPLLEARQERDFARRHTPN